MEITGRLTAKATVKEVKGGKKVTEFTIAINDSYRPKDGQRVQLTTYIECAYWLNAGLAEYLNKGTLVTLTGRLGVNAWLNKDGEPKATITCNVSNIKLLGQSSKQGTDRAESEAVKKEAVYADSAKGDDDLPF
ncbi:single-stranded DNA-binding protein [Pedobacter sp. ISL-68]|uniref:single-stranded DNA-binding protein n=1 Tax=unclassified Pedobacter TaxID=2628915 RepID=UPI001BE8579D|nr:MULTISPECIES: single-stranded DNA-binding protein [unclassified Pedobacter]MBT2560169.1 single-stranded DNA-binding protein [Pedobacter sp. ISL-64]MBT2589148.1 single-stranded DNA-binding protein [Pedobacter sp. ISL-68]